MNRIRNMNMKMHALANFVMFTYYRSSLPAGKQD